MIRYDLVCSAGHAFDAWFPGSDAYDSQAKAGLVSCPHCGTSKVSKAIMAPSLARRPDAGPAASPDVPELSGGMPAEVRKALRAYRQQILSQSENVGMAFFDEARRMHRGEAPARAVHGEASAEQARALIEEGVAVAPIPPDLGGH